MSVLDRVQLAAQELVHGEHVDLVLLEDGVELFVAEDLSLVARVLELVALDVVPELLDDLGAGELPGGVSRSVTPTGKKKGGDIKGECACIPGSPHTAQRAESSD